MRAARSTWLLAAAAACLPSPAVAQDVSELSELSIEELAEIQVTSASKRAEPLAGAPTAIYVIGNEDIIRSAATSLPEVLRQAPNLDVRQVDARQYAISARGFNGVETANKMLATIDGRSIYSTLYSGILWELHAPLLEDIEQIEVISGPGGTLYGPNAVNGVISVQTRSARDTIGGLVRGSAGANEQTAAARYGLPLGESGAIRVYGNFWNREDRPGGAAPDIDDRYRGWQAGFRADLGSDESAVTVQGDVFDTDVATLPGDGERGHNLLARWTRRTGDDSSFQVQGYYDFYRRHTLLVLDELETFDLQGQYDSRIGRHQLVAGVGVRTTRDRFDNNLNAFVLDPERKRLWIGNVFVQDRFAISETLALTAGVKFEESSFSGLEILPNVRLAWQPDERTLLWGAVSRAVRTPSRIDRQLVALPLLAKADDFRSETLTAIEAGYRGQIGDSSALSVNLFYNLYDDIRTTEFAPSGGLPIRLMNSLGGETWGIEAWATQQVARWWRLRVGLAVIEKDFEVDPGRVDLAAGGSAGNDPGYRVTARSQMNLSDRLTLDVGVRIIDDLELPAVDAYAEAEARLGWRISDAVELYVAGSNLLHDAHSESGDPQREQLAVRSVLAGTRLRF